MERKTLAIATTSVRERDESHGTREWRRLVKIRFRRLEFNTTVYFLERRLPPGGLVLDADGLTVVETVGLEGLGSHSVVEISRLSHRQ